MPTVIRTVHDLVRHARGPTHHHHHQSVHEARRIRAHHILVTHSLA
ncbi:MULTISPECIES: hypothetical protein [Rhodococcus]|jgi:hypothetical protein|nr:MULTISPECIES: hypothetical protein [Rhodococcus]MBP2525347.1 hypothetical protein [Rhodococcus sp. PvP104]MBQ9056851.1 hypothetical protein [Rhodococcus sp. (in: high G+C Gram-positive bacteria)]MCD2134199.1 hypothetical protein [Rhodococcus qingshengii]MCE4161693.1 hypothetical protein [Rhodococcus sp. Ni2]MCX6475549.1 hypothetical protein [Rhodococcus sp. (in: high G+C Gram-positive bacteria)]